MIGCWRPFALAGALHFTVGASVVTAQTLIVRNAPAQSTVDAVLNTTTIGSATVDRDASATFAVDILRRLGKTETSVHVFVDACPTMLRVVLAEPGVVEAASGCARKQIWGVFAVRTVTTLVVDVGGTEPAMWLRQGPAPLAWLGQESAGDARVWSPAPTGLTLSGGAGFSPFGAATGVACGNVTGCAGEASWGAYSVAAAYWVKRFVAAEVSYLEPRRTSVSGNGDTFRFTSTLDTKVFTVAAKAGVPVGPARIYGTAGRSYHGATSLATQTVDNATQRFELKTTGWGWTFGGGAEFWLSRRAAIYGELGRVWLKGADRAGGEARIDDHVTVTLFGARIRIAG